MPPTKTPGRALQLTAAADTAHCACTWTYSLASELDNSRCHSPSGLLKRPLVLSSNSLGMVSLVLAESEPTSPQAAALHRCLRHDRVYTVCHILWQSAIDRPDVLGFRLTSKPASQRKRTAQMAVKQQPTAAEAKHARPANALRLQEQPHCHDPSAG